MSTRRCTATTKAGKPCRAAPLKDGDFCLAHADADVRASVGFVPEAGNQGGRPRKPRPSEIARELIEANELALQRPYWRTLGFDVLVGDNGCELVELPKGGAKVTATFEGEVRVSDVEDLGAQIEAAEKLQDRVYGRPRQEITGADGAPLQLEVTGAAILNDADARKHAAGLRKRVGATRKEQPGRSRARH